MTAACWLDFGSFSPLVVPISAELHVCIVPALVSYSSQLKTFLTAYFIWRLLENILLEPDTDLDHSVYIWRIGLVRARKTKISNSEMNYVSHNQTMERDGHLGLQNQVNSHVEDQAHALID